MLNRRILLTFGGAALAGLMFVPSLALADEAANVAVVKDYVAAWNAHDTAKAVGYFADDVTYYDASVGDPVTGKATAEKDVVGNFIGAAPDLKWEMLGDPIAQGDMIAFQWRFSGTNTGAWSDGSEATNKPFEFMGATVMSVVDGQIKTQSDYYDSMDFYEQLGWIDEDEEEE
jgi:steroid delta-isomerase-like uncharacterized protein